MESTTILIQHDGGLKLPEELCRKYRLQEGDLLTLTDLGNGSFLITPLDSPINRLSALIENEMSEADVTLDDMLEALEEERERYYQEHYTSPSSPSA